MGVVRVNAEVFQHPGQEEEARLESGLHSEDAAAFRVGQRGYEVLHPIDRLWRLADADVSLQILVIERKSEQRFIFEIVFVRKIQLVRLEGLEQRISAAARRLLTRLDLAEREPGGDRIERRP